MSSLSEKIVAYHGHVQELTRLLDRVGNGDPERVRPIIRPVEERMEAALARVIEHAPADREELAVKCGFFLDEIARMCDGNPLIEQFRSSLLRDVGSLPRQ